MTLTLAQVQAKQAQTQPKAGSLTLAQIQQKQAPSPAPVGNPADQASADEFKPSFPAKTGSALNPVRTLGNIPKSAGQFVKGVFQSLNPVKVAATVKDTFSQLPAAIKEQGGGVKGFLKEEANTLKAFPKAAYKALVPKAIQNLVSGNTEEAERSVVNDPVGQIAPLVFMAKGASEVAGKGAAFDSAISKTAKPAIDAVKLPVKAAGKATAATTKFGVSQATGLNPETITHVVDHPEYFSRKALEVNDRASLAGEVKKAIDSRLEHLSDTGKGYEFIRQGKDVVKIAPNTITDVLAKKGISIENGKLKFTQESIPMSAVDKAALQDFVDTFGTQPELSGNAFMNARTALSNLSKFEQGKTNASTVMARELRAAYDTHGKTQIQGLKELDATYGPEAQLMKQIKTDYLKPDGTFKDGALNKLANLTGKGKEAVLNRLEEVSPGIGTKIKTLKAVEDIQAASGHKVGTYARNIFAGTLASGGNPVTGILVAAVSNPAIAVPLLRLYGKTLKVSSATIDHITTNFIQSLKDANDNPNIGLSVKDVSKAKPYQKNGKVYIPGQKAVPVNTYKPQEAGAFPKALRQGEKLPKR